MARLDTETEGETEAFFHQIIDQAQPRSIRNLTTGSSVEIPDVHRSMQAYQLDPGSLDTDRMFYYINYYAIPRCKVLPEGYNGTVYRIFTDGLHAGFAKLLDDKSGLELLHDKIWIVFWR